MKRYLGFSLAALVFTLSACGDDDDDSGTNGPTVFGKSYSIVSGDLTVTESQVAGSGVVSFGQFVDTPAEGRNLFAKMTLEDQGYVQFHVFAAADLGNATLVRLTRNGDQLTYTVNRDDGDEQGSFADVDASQTVNISIEVHNSETPAHVLMWSGDAAPAGEPLEVQGDNGQGTYLGLTLEKATLLSIADGPEEIEDEE
jgi:hypothetical protein